MTLYFESRVTGPLVSSIDPIKKQPNVHGNIRGRPSVVYQS